jgi:SAM-dependent methyltransferase
MIDERMIVASASAVPRSRVNDRACLRVSGFREPSASLRIPHAVLRARDSQRSASETNYHHSLRTYYDHEAAYLSIAERGGTGWDDLPTLPAGPQDSYVALEAFLASPLAAPGDALELGCGGGQASLRLAVRGYHVTGVDFAPTAIALARENAKRAGVDVRFIEADCLALALPDAAFDLVVDNHALHCILGDDRARFLAEAARVLRPGGLLFTDTMSREGGLDPTKLPVDLATFCSHDHNRYWVGAAELDGELATAGFSTVFAESRAIEPGHGSMLVRVARKR